MGLQNSDNRLTLSPSRQTLSRRHQGDGRYGDSVCAVRSGSRVPFRVFWAAFFFAIAAGSPTTAQLVDPLDAYPPRWQLGHSDCEARVVRHINDPVAGIGGSGCESLTISGGRGTETLLEYRIEPIRVIDELTARVYVKSAKAGQSVGLRVRFPLVTDPATGQSVSVIILGASYRDTGQWQLLGVGGIEKPLRVKTYALRNEYGAEADFSKSFVDAVVINAYTGPGDTTILIDNLAIDSMVSVSSMKAFADPPTRASPAATPTARMASDRIATGNSNSAIDSARQRAARVAGVFPAGRVWRVLQHNGEPLQWVKTLGFNAVLLPRPADHAILTEAMRAGVKLYAPPPTLPDPNLTALLEPLAGYYLGTSLAGGDLVATQNAADTIARWPTAWQRPVIAAPAESFREYAALADVLVHDLPPPIRGLAGAEEIAALTERRASTGRASIDVVAFQTDAPPALRKQLDAISAAIGAPRGDDTFWHSQWLQVARSLELSPRAVLFRSSSTLTSGTAEAQRRSLAISYINRYIEAIGGIVAGGVAASPMTTSGPPYHCGRIDFPNGQLLIATTTAQDRGLTLAGDGQSLRITLPPGDSTKIAWRLTHFAAERLAVTSNSGGVHLEVVSPDVVETIILSSDPAMGGRIATAMRPMASQAASDRWQLTQESLDQVRTDWQAATGSRIVAASPSVFNMIGAAESTLREAEPTFRSGDAGATLRMARRADAWILKSRWQLHAALSPGREPRPNISCPPLLAVGGAATQILWWPLMADDGWGDNLLIGGSLDSPQLLGQAGWTVGRRPESADTIRSDVSIASGPQAEGTGCLVANVVAAEGANLPGGYAGTTLQIRSPSVRFAPKSAIRIDAQIRTLGFGGPDQGVLVYDSVAGPELGVLIRATPQWQTVRLYRQTLGDGEVNVLFELIGAGEVTIDDVQVRQWRPSPGMSQTDPSTRLRPIDN